MVVVFLLILYVLATFGHLTQICDLGFNEDCAIVIGACHYAIGQCCKTAQFMSTQSNCVWLNDINGTISSFYLKKYPTIIIDPQSIQILISEMKANAGENNNFTVICATESSWVNVTLSLPMTSGDL